MGKCIEWGFMRCVACHRGQNRIKNMKKHIRSQVKNITGHEFI